MHSRTSVYVPLLLWPRGLRGRRSQQLLEKIRCLGGWSPVHVPWLGFAHNKGVDCESVHECVTEIDCHRGLGYNSDHEYITVIKCDTQVLFSVLSMVQLYNNTFMWTMAASKRVNDEEMKVLSNITSALPLARDAVRTDSVETKSNSTETITASPAHTHFAPPLLPQCVSCCRAGK